MSGPKDPAPTPNRGGQSDLQAQGPIGANAATYAWLMVALLVPVALLNYLDRQMLAAMKFSMMTDIADIGTEANWGKILALFKWTYAFCSPFGGYLADRFSRRHLIAGSLMVWSAVTWETGQATTFDQLLLTRAVMGISEAFYIPAALSLIADYHRGGTRSRAVGMHQMGIYAGVILGGFSGYAADDPGIGWRKMFWICGFIGVLYAVPLYFLVRNPAKVNHSAGEPRPSAGGTFRELLGNVSFILLVLYFTLPAVAGWIVRDWMPAILKSEFGIGQGKAGVSATLYWMLAATGAALGGGWLADRWTRSTPRGRIYTSAIGMVFIVIAMMGVGYSPSTHMVGVAIGFLIVFGMGYGFFDANNMPILCQITRPQFRATGYGIMNLVSISCGGFADWGFGVLRDLHVPLMVIFGAVAAMSFASVFLVLLIRPRYADGDWAPGAGPTKDATAPGSNPDSCGRT